MIWTQKSRGWDHVVIMEALSVSPADQEWTWAMEYIEDRWKVYKWMDPSDFDRSQRLPANWTC